MSRVRADPRRGLGFAAGAGCVRGPWVTGMEKSGTRERTSRRALAPALMVVAALVGGCGSNSYRNENLVRPHRSTSLRPCPTAESPSRRAGFGAGPIVLIVTNQTGASQAITFESDELGASTPGITQTTEPINPRGTGQLKVNVTEGSYRVRAENADIAPANITVGPSRPSAQNQLLQP